MRIPGRAEPVGEAWLTGPQCVVETGPLAGRTLAEVAAEAAKLWWVRVVMESFRCW